jgi:N-acyl-L-homoserine lactone synthetase
MSEGTDRLHAIFCNEEQNPGIVDQFLCFRKGLFVDVLHWDLTVESGRERDQFDTNDAVYCALLREGDLIAGFRAIRTDLPYVAKCVFPQLAVFATYPQKHDAWEISRFGVRPSEAGSVTARMLYSLMFRFAHLTHATSLVALADLRYERFLSLLGIRTRRYGPPQIIGTDERGAPLAVVAGDIPLQNQRGRRFESLLELANTLEIDDEALVFRPRRLSA